MDVMNVERVIQTDDGPKWKVFVEQFNLEADFAMDDQQIEMEVCRMGQLLVRYGTIAAEQNANLKRKEEFAKLMSARVSAAVRSDAEAHGRKTTEPQLKEEVTAHASYQAALAELHILRADAIKADHWFSALMKKADLLKSLCFRQGAEINRMPG
jgi:hypothetical protein